MQTGHGSSGFDRWSQGSGLHFERLANLYRIGALYTRARLKDGPRTRPLGLHLALSIGLSTRVVCALVHARIAGGLAARLRMYFAALLLGPIDSKNDAARISIGAHLSACVRGLQPRSAQKPPRALTKAQQKARRDHSAPAKAPRGPREALQRLADLQQKPHRAPLEVEKGPKEPTEAPRRRHRPARGPDSSP